MENGGIFSSDLIPVRSARKQAAMLLIGIDEAGYGPKIGPLCHGYCAIRCPDVSHDVSLTGTPPDLWKLLHPTVMRHPALDGSITVDDSKKAYSPALGLGLLRRAIASFHMCSRSAAVSISASEIDLTHLIPQADLAKLEEDDWGRSLPIDSAAIDVLSKPRVPKSKRKKAELSESPVHIPPLDEALKSRDISVLAVGARALSAKHYNVAINSNDNKADVNWSVIAQQLQTLLELARPEEPVIAWIDRLGGRKFYAAQLSALFSGAMPWVESETPLASVYRIEDGARIVRIAFLVNADGQTLPVALASMAAKLTRELCMQRMNGFFKSHAPEIKPTAGYYGDANRFLKETRQLRKKLGIANADLIRLK